MIRVGLVIVLIAIGAALLGPTLTPYDPASQELARRLEGPSLSHPLGLDELGRDILARLLAGARISLLVGLAVVSVSSTSGPGAAWAASTTRWPGRTASAGTGPSSGRVTQAARAAARRRSSGRRLTGQRYIIRR